MPHVSVSVNGIRQNGPRGRVYATTDVRPATRPSGATAFSRRPPTAGIWVPSCVLRDREGQENQARGDTARTQLRCPSGPRARRARRSGLVSASSSVRYAVRRATSGPRAPRLTGRQIRKNITCTQDVPPCVERYRNLTALGHRRWTRLASHGARGCCLRSYRPPTYRSPLA